MIALAVENGLAQLQRAFADAIFFDDAPIPATIRAASGRAHASRFGVYRNNVIAGLIKAVAARYPVVRKLLWDDAFRPGCSSLRDGGAAALAGACLSTATAFRNFSAASGKAPLRNISPTWPSSKLRARAPTTPPMQRRSRRDAFSALAA